MFHHQRKKNVASQAKSLKDLSPMLTAAQVLADNKRQELLQKMRSYSGLETVRYDSLCVTLIDNLTHYCQNLPESTNSYYAQAGGLVDHALNRTEAALSLLQEFMIYDKKEGLSEEQKLWQYALYSAAILQGIGKLVIDYQINLFDSNGQALKQWNPLLETLVNVGSYYDYEFQKEKDVEFRRRLNLLMAKNLMPASGFAWIASNQQVLAVWLALLNEDQRSAGTLGALLIRADAIAIQRYFNEFLIRAASGRGRALGRAGTFSGGVPETVTEKEQSIGAEFIQWLIKALGEGLIMINKAPLMMVPGGFLMCPEMFQLFVREHSEYKNWQAIQKAFLSLQLHSYAADGGLESRFEQTQNQQMHSGIVFSEYAIALPNEVNVHQMHTGKTVHMSATEFIHNTQEHHQFTQHNKVVVEPLKQLAASGQWSTIEQEAPTRTPGVQRGV